MACAHPLVRIEYKNSYYQTKNGNISKKAKILGLNSIDPSTGRKFGEYENILKYANKNPNFENATLIPCGKCVQCRLKTSKEWATRCMAECEEWEHNYFVTLTYDPEHLPVPEEMVNYETGEIFLQKEEWKGCLIPEDLKKFMKDLRRYYKYHYNHDNIRFYGCGEYGGEGHRPHYHLIIFNLPIEPKKLEPFFINKNHQQIYICDEIQKIWGKGLISIGSVTWSSCAYVARYIMKKQGGEIAEENYLRNGQIKEFTRMSLKPGIGKTYYKKHKDDIYENDEIIQKTIKGNIGSAKPPKYYDRLFDLDSPEAMEAIKQKRKELAEKAEKLKYQNTTLTKRQQLELEERQRIEKIKSLTRNIKLD